MDKTIEELRIEAEELGISFAKNIGAKKLAEKIEDFYKADEDSAVVILDEDEVKDVEVEEVPTSKANKPRTLRERANAAKKVAGATRVITITDNDQRENNLTTVVSVTCTNAYFDLGTRKIPLNVPVEVAQGFINVLNEVKIPMHIQNQLTGLGQTVMRKRYAISYEDK